MAASFENPTFSCLNSRSIPPNEAREHGCFTILPVRVSTRSDVTEDDTQYRLAKQWKETFGDHTFGTDGPESYNGSQNKVFGPWDALTQPEAKHERLKYTLWLTAFFFLVDDKAASMSRLQAHESYNRQLVRIFANEGSDEDLTTPMQKIAVPFIRDLLQCDCHRGIPILQAWQEWLENVDAKAIEDLDSIEAYIQFRAMNSGIIPYLPHIRYTMELTISPDELRLLEEFQTQAVKCTALANDYWSWPSEAAANAKYHVRIMNIVPITSRLKGVSIEEAFEMTKQLVIDYEQQLLTMYTDLRSKYSHLSEDFQRYMMAILWLVSGNHAWSSNCPRYDSPNNVTLM
ncbi:Ophiobolin F synthase oblA-like protein [Cladobotryum mycophilum]|uniref:Ophiobolin F synthase oblA-like protein n=1 Tax=Cladobotryum mycophilum TaxID=491253 RepID=A0ABR0T039_9HYPO